MQLQDGLINHIHLTKNIFTSNYWSFKNYYEAEFNLF